MKSRKKTTKPAKTFKPKPRKPYIWTIRISDGYAAYEYLLEDRHGNKSIQDVYEAARRELSAEPSAGRYVFPIET
jgi:hypothetical protein